MNSWARLPNTGKLDDADRDPAGQGNPMRTEVAALASLATRLGIDLNTEQLRKRFAIGEEEPTSDLT